MKEIYFALTGNPFVDAGIYAISYWVKKEIEDIQKEDLRTAIQEITDLYLTPQWQKNMQSIFPNSKLINPAVKDKYNAYLSFLEELLDQLEPLGEQGGCIGCGRKKAIELTKTQAPLTGSGKLVNFFSYGIGGADYCAACALATQFSPLVYYNGGGRFYLVHASSPVFMDNWAYKCVQHVRQYNAAGIFDEGYRNPTNSIFHITETVIKSARELKEHTQVDVYNFTNYNQGPELDIISLPTSVFSFLVKIQDKKLWNAWAEVKNRGFVIKNEEKYDEGVHKNYRNYVYNYLINKRSIVRSFIDFKNQKALGGWKLLSLYLQEVRKMEEKRIHFIKELSNKIAQYIETNDDKKAFQKFIYVRNYSGFRLALLYVMNQMSKYAEEPLFRLDDYIKYIVPEVKLWPETKDLIIFGLFEKLHDWIQKEEMPEIEIDKLEEEEE